MRKVVIGLNLYKISSTNRKYLKLNAKAIKADMSSSEIKQIENILSIYPNVGERYPEEVKQLVISIIAKP